MLTLKQIFELDAKLPKHISADWQDTNHYEIHTSEDTFWLDLSELFSSKDLTMPCDTEMGKRLGLMMDVFEAAPDMVAHLRRLQNYESELEFYKQNVIALEPDAEPIVDDVVMIGNCVMHVVEDGAKENIFVSLKDAKQAWLNGDLQWILSRNGKAAICKLANYKERV